MYILDTNVISAVRRPDRAPQVAAWLRARNEAELFLSVITLGEIERGIRAQERINPVFAADLRAWVDRTVRLFSDRILPFGADDARIWGRLSQDIGNSGADLMIAATALAHDAVVVTGNEDDFRPTGARLENPFRA
ncbi:type II toxin-antitoxin system VapC family toxin [Pseudogemmobacter humi]|uniref:Ribonuclease VapC n=1 Tax=Pseudogemmobacter humi TaxID=2483812 RepID=A0A3P5XWW4_9RHOB|nr:type II toxin-antitoxin system VapC family toxin [Pseudogemmobacter humi]VDC33668.1 Toxin FitB [Pseudogemmobacter humi]